MTNHVHASGWVIHKRP